MAKILSGMRWLMILPLVRNGYGQAIAIMVKSGVGSPLVGEKFMPMYIFFLGPGWNVALFMRRTYYNWVRHWSDRRMVSSQTSNLICRSKCIRQFNVKYLSWSSIITQDILYALRSAHEKSNVWLAVAPASRNATEPSCHSKLLGRT